MASKLRWLHSLSLLLVVLFFQNCGKFQATPAMSAMDLPSLPQDNLPATDRYDENCLANSDFDACIFFKNPVAQERVAFSKTLTSSSNLSSLQNFGVKLTDLNSSEVLVNTYFEIISYTDQSVNLQTDLRSPNFDIHKTSQIMSYYWLNQSRKILIEKTGKYYAEDLKIKVYVDDLVSGWNSHRSSIHLGLTDDQRPLSLNAEVLSYYLGLANLNRATNGSIDVLDDNKHKTCGRSQNVKQVCCEGQNGCAKAIASGVADYLVALVFPEDTRIAQTYLNSLDGQRHCGIPRDLNTNASLTVQQSFSLCASSEEEGNVQLMGHIYASIWWEVRRQAQNETDAFTESEVDQLYSEHLALLNGQDDFLTALNKIQEVDQQLFNGKYGSLFEQEYRRRGL